MVPVLIRRAPFLAAPVLALTLSSCAALGTSGSSAGSEAGDGPSVAAAFYPLAWVAERVGGERAQVDLLTSPGAEPHDLELGVGETATVAGADLVVLLDGFQPAVDQAAAESAEGTVLDAADVVDLRVADTEHAAEEHAEDEHAGEEAGEHADEEHTEDDGHGHAEGDLDPHFWLDPLRVAALGDAVAEELAAADPEGAAGYEAAAADLRADLEQLDGEYADGLAACERDTVVVNHDAFGYLTRYGLEFAPIAGLSPDSEPSPGDLAALQELIRDQGVTTVFSESLVSPETAETLAADLGIAADVLDPLEGLTAQTADEDYLSLMRANLSALQAANGC